MRVTVDDVNFCDSLGSTKSVHQQYVNCRLIHGFGQLKQWLLIACANSSGLQILGRRYDVHNNVAYIITTKS